MAGPSSVELENNLTPFSQTRESLVISASSPTYSTFAQRETTSRLFAARYVSLVLFEGYRLLALESISKRSTLEKLLAYAESLQRSIPTLQCYSGTPHVGLSSDRQQYRKFEERAVLVLLFPDSRSSPPTTQQLSSANTILDTLLYLIF